VKYLDEFRDPVLARSLVERLRRAVTRPWTIMEICGGQTHSILRHGIDQVLPPGLELVHGPGCPVCVTPLETIDRALAVAARPEVILTSFGDMLRVPGSRGSLLEARSRGADVRMVYSPLEALALARATLRAIRQNLFWAFFYNAAAVPLAALGFLSPVICAAAMGMSDLIVIGNALRLRRISRRFGYENQALQNPGADVRKLRMSEEQGYSRCNHSVFAATCSAPAKE